MLQYNYSDKSNKSGTLRVPLSSTLETSPLVLVTSSSSHTVVSSSHPHSDSSSLTSSNLHWYESSWNFGKQYMVVFQNFKDFIGCLTPKNVEDEQSLLISAAKLCSLFLDVWQYDFVNKLQCFFFVTVMGFIRA